MSYFTGNLISWILQKARIHIIKFAAKFFMYIENSCKFLICANLSSHLIGNNFQFAKKKKKKKKKKERKKNPCCKIDLL